MPTYQALTPSTHRGKRWKRYTDYRLENRGQTTVFSNPLPRENRGLSPISLNQSSLKEAWNAFFGT